VVDRGEGGQGGPTATLPRVLQPVHPLAAVRDRTPVREKTFSRCLRTLAGDTTSRRAISTLL
jgi:hypothetical protein